MKKFISGIILLTVAGFFALIYKIPAFVETFKAIINTFKVDEDAFRVIIILCLVVGFGLFVVGGVEILPDNPKKNLQPSQ